MNRSAKPGLWIPTQTSLATPDNPLWVLEAWVDGEFKHKYHRVVSVRTVIYHTYLGGTKTAPHHTELLKNGWAFQSTKQIHDVLYTDGREILGSSEYSSNNSMITVVERNPDIEALKVLKKELGVPADATINDLLDEQLSILRSDDHRKNTYSMTLRTVLGGYIPEYTISLTASYIQRRVDWIVSVFNLRKRLHIEALKLVLSDRMSLANAYMLTRLTPEDQYPDMIERAVIMKSQDFTPLVMAKLKEIRDSK